MPDIDWPRMAVEPGVPSSARVERRGDCVGHLARRMSHPFGDEDNLGIGELGNGVARQRATCGLAAGSGEQRRGEHETGMAARPGDDAGDHGAAAGVMRVGVACRSAQATFRIHEERVHHRDALAVAQPADDRREAVQRAADVDRVASRRRAGRPRASAHTDRSDDCSSAESGTTSVLRARGASFTQPTVPAAGAAPPPTTTQPHRRRRLVPGGWAVRP